MTNLQLTFYSVLKTVNFSCIIRKKDNDAHSLHFYLTCTVLNSLATTSQRKRDQSHPNQKGRCKAVTICSWCDIIYGNLNACTQCAQLCPTLCNSIRSQSARVLCPWNFPGKEYCSRWPFPPPKDLPDPGIKSTSPAWAGGLKSPSKNHQN